MIALALRIATIISVLSLTQSQNISLFTPSETVVIAQNGIINTSFSKNHQHLKCGMPELYIYMDSLHQPYSIITSAVLIESITSKWNPILFNIVCETNNSCVAQIHNQCNIDSDNHEINWIQIETSIGQIQYLVNCNPSIFYKPIQWGLFILIVLASLILTLSSLYSRAWSYGGYGYQITNRAIIVINVLLFVGIFLAYIATDIMSFVIQILGSLLGAFGVTVCTSECIWLLNNKNFQRKICKQIRVIDVMSMCVGIIFIPAYWVSDGQWIINNVMAICTIVALMKLIKIRSLSIAFYLTISILIVEIIVGVFVHYVFKLSYNNYVINYFQSPIMLVMPSITHQLYRQCAWLPVTSVLLPGLLLSYLRRFDLTRGTFLYLYFGLVSFYAGSICWMVIDLETIHSLPFAIISEPVTILIVYVYSFRRNQFKTLWRGNFHDEQLEESSYILHKQTEIIGNTTQIPTAYVDLTENLRMSETSGSSQYQSIKMDEDHKI